MVMGCDSGGMLGIKRAFHRLHPASRFCSNCAVRAAAVENNAMGWWQSPFSQRIIVYNA